MIEAKGLRKSFFRNGKSIDVLRDIFLDVRDGDYIAIMGESGSGKSTLMNMIGCLDKPDHGELHLFGKDVRRMSERDLAELRNSEIGFVFQSFYLLSGSTAAENVELPMKYAKIPDKGIGRWPCWVGWGFGTERSTFPQSFPEDSAKESLLPALLRTDPG